MFYPHYINIWTSSFLEFEGDCGWFAYSPTRCLSAPGSFSGISTWWVHKRRTYPKAGALGSELFLAEKLEMKGHQLIFWDDLTGNLWHLCCFNMYVLRYVGMTDPWGFGTNPAVSSPMSSITPSTLTGWWFQTVFIFHNIWDNLSHWLIFLKMDKTTKQWMIPPQPKQGERMWKVVAGCSTQQLQ